MARQNEKLTASISDNISFAASSQINLGDSLSITGGTEPYSYSWKSANTVISTDVNFIVTPTIVPSAFEVTVTDSENCRVVKSVVIIVGIEEEDFIPVKIYPVPATSFITIDPGHILSQLTVTLFSVSGEKIWQKSINQMEKIDLDQKAGIYILELKMNSLRSVRKIVITGK